MRVQFVKMHGCGNDFVVIDERAAPLGLTAAQIVHLADRHRGVGCDQLVTIGTGPFVRFYNPDGAEAGACGNATRCVAWLLGRESGQAEVALRGIAGDLPSTVLADGRVTVDMGAPRLAWQDVPLAGPADTLRLDLGLGP